MIFSPRYFLIFHKDFVKKSETIDFFSLLFPPV